LIILETEITVHSSNGQAAGTVRFYYTDNASASPSRANLPVNINADVSVINNNIFLVHGYSGYGVTVSYLVDKLISDVIGGHAE
jgi:hypothetical protein